MQYKLIGQVEATSIGDFSAFVIWTHNVECQYFRRLTAGLAMPRLLRPDLKTGKIPAELLRWRMARREIYIGTDLEIVLKLSPAN
jgi:hypothetical protein